MSSVFSNAQKDSGLLNPDDHLKRNPVTESLIQRYDHSLNRISLAQRWFPQINGKDFVLSIKERSFNLKDADLINRSFTTSYSPNTVDLHATEMATLAAGSGNSGMSGLGVATKSILTPASFQNLMPEPLNYYTSNRISVQNHSYGTGIENEYAEDAEAYDLSTWQHPVLLHVFSAGNQGSSTAINGRYAGIAGFSNLTGSFKMSKNSISVGATDSFLQIETLSSRGPAHDGRLKPELVAFGVDGSSGAAALVSGSALLLQDMLFRQTGSIPPASLIKSLLITGAKSHGSEGPDYVYGYGHLDIFNSLKVTDQLQYLHDSISNGNQKSFSLTLPENTALLKVTLCWSDTSGRTGTNKALINDLDLSVTDPNTTIYLPWTLSAFPHADSLKKTALRLRDTLNNTEQVTIKNPISGTYNVRINASMLTTAKQSWSISWDIIKADTFYFTNPVSNVPTESGEHGIIRWNHSFPEGTTGTLEYRFIENNNWITVSNSIDISKYFHTITLPDEISLMQY
ncbi:MAG: S8 family serine peptidase, partial [Chitinophagaceae bacterium]|nr:S8 family serine peptidase [Chitinophagaceae bacterium]